MAGKRKNGGSDDSQPTMHDVAKLAGVSQMTVSRVMRGTGYLSPTVRDQVRAAAREIGYVHNRLARGHSAYDNPLVGVVVPTLQNRVFTEVLSGISDTLDRYGLRPVFGVAEYASEIEERIVFDLLSWRPRGLILAGVEHTDPVRQIVKQTGVKTAEIMDIDGVPLSACFGISHTDAGRTMAQHLIERGYRTFGYIASQGGKDLRASKRFDGFAETVRQAGGRITAEKLSADASSMVVGRKMAEEILAAADAPEALYFSNDDLAAGGLMHCLANGISVPGDVAIAGFNGLDFLNALPMQITTTQTPRYKMGEAAADWIANADTQDSEPAVHELDTKLIIGDTT